MAASVSSLRIQRIGGQSACGQDFAPKPQQLGCTSTGAFCGAVNRPIGWNGWQAFDGMPSVQSSETYFLDVTAKATSSAPQARILCPIIRETSVSL